MTQAAHSMTAPLPRLRHLEKITSGYYGKVKGRQLPWKLTNVSRSAAARKRTNGRAERGTDKAAVTRASIWAVRTRCDIRPPVPPALLHPRGKCAALLRKVVEQLSLLRAAGGRPQNEQFVGDLYLGGRPSSVMMLDDTRH